MPDLQITETDMWTAPLKLEKGDYVSVSVKGDTWSGTIKVRRWLVEYGLTTTSAHYGVIQSYTANIESVDISGGAYYYQIGTDEAFTGNCYVHLQ